MSDLLCCRQMRLSFILTHLLQMNLFCMFTVTTPLQSSILLHFPNSRMKSSFFFQRTFHCIPILSTPAGRPVSIQLFLRSEERRVGKECIYLWSCVFCILML